MAYINDKMRRAENSSEDPHSPQDDVSISQPAPALTVFPEESSHQLETPKKRKCIHMPMPAARPRKTPLLPPRQSQFPIHEQQRQNMYRLKNAINEERESVRTFTYQPGNENEIIGNYKDATITRGSVHRLQPGQWLNDELIQYFTKMVTNQDVLSSSADLSRKRSNIFSSLFYTTLMGEGGTYSYSYEAVKTWTSKTTDDIFELDKILIPINVNNSHWIALMVSMVDKSIQLYDPVGENSNAQLYFDQILRFLNNEHFNKKGMSLPDTSKWRLVLQDPQLPTQPNGYDCGVYISAFIYFSVVNLPFRRGLTTDNDIFAADLRFRFTRSIMSKIIYF